MIANSFYVNRLRSILDNYTTINTSTSWIIWLRTTPQGRKWTKLPPFKLWVSDSIFIHNFLPLSLFSCILLFVGLLLKTHKQSHNLCLDWFNPLTKQELFIVISGSFLVFVYIWSSYIGMRQQILEIKSTLFRFGDHISCNDGLFQDRGWGWGGQGWKKAHGNNWGEDK